MTRHGCTINSLYINKANPNSYIIDYCFTIHNNMERKSLYGFFFFLLIVFAPQFMVQTEARVCESQSHRFKGPCAGDHNCALVCRNEGFSGGRCRGFRRRCFCTKLC